MTTTTISQLRKGKFALFQIALPMKAEERAEETSGVMVWDESTGEAALRFRRDFHLIADEDELEVMIQLEQDLESKLNEMGLHPFLDWAQSTLSNSLLLSEPEPVTIDSIDRTLTRLYRKHVPARIQQYETHLPRVALAAAAGSWGDAMTPDSIADQADEWMEVPEDLSVDDQMFIAQVVGRSMEPEIPDGSLCVFRYQPAGSRDGRKVLVENFSDASQRYTVKRYQSQKKYDEDGQIIGRRVRLEPLNPEFSPWELEEGEDVRILAEFIRVLD